MMVLSLTLAVGPIILKTSNEHHCRCTILSMFCDWKMENDRTFTLAVPNRLLGDYNWAYPSEVKSQGHGTLKDGV